MRSEGFYVSEKSTDSMCFKYCKFFKHLLYLIARGRGGKANSDQ